MSVCRRSIPFIPLHFKLYSSSSRTSVDNYYLRQRRKWPLSPYKTKWQQSFTHQLAMQKLVQSSNNISPKSHLLSILIDSFSAYQCNPTPNAYFFILKTLTQHPSTLDQIPQILDHIRKVEKFETPEYIFTYLIKFYGDYSNMTHLAFELFFTMQGFRCNTTVKSLNALIWVLCKNNCDLRIVLLVLVKCQLMNIWVEESTFKILIKALCRIGKANNAVDLLNLMVDSGFNLDGNICSLILSTMSERKECQRIEIWGILEEMRKLGYVPKRIDLCNVIRFYVKNGKGVAALEVLNKMKMSGIMVPDIVCYNLILNGLILEGEYSSADEVFDELLVLGLSPDIVTYNVYINGLCKQNKVDEALRMLGCMEDLGCKPEMNTYHTILEALCRSTGMLFSAKEVFGQMKLKGLRLNSHIYGVVINCMIRNGEVDEAYNLLHEMVAMGFVPQSITSDGLIHLLCQRGLLSEVMELLSIMVSKNVVPGVRSWEALVQALFNSSKEDSSK